MRFSLDNMPSYSNLAVYLAFAFLFLVQLSLSAWPEYLRSLPVELDDALTYTFKAVLFQECVWDSNCPALQSFANVLDLNKRSTSNFDEFILSRQIFEFYHPIHSVLLFGVNLVFDDWLFSFQVLRVASSIFIIYAIAKFLTVFLDRGAICISATLLGCTTFPEQGIHIVTPSNFTVAICLWMTTLLTELNSKKELIKSYAVTIVALTSHPISLVVTPFLWLYFLWNGGAKVLIKTRVQYTLGAAFLWLFVFFVYTQSSWPIFKTPIQYLPDGHLESGIPSNLLNSFFANIVAAFITLRKGILQFGGEIGGLVFLFFLVVGFISQKLKQAPIYKLALVFMLMGGVSSLHQFFRPGLLFDRIYVLLFIIMIALFSQGLWSLIVRSNFRPDEYLQRVLEPNFGESKKRKGFLIGLMGVALITVPLFLYLTSGLLRIETEINARIQRHDLQLDTALIQSTLRTHKERTSIVSADTAPHGSLRVIPTLLGLIYSDLSLDFMPLKFLERARLTGGPFWQDLIKKEAHFIGLSPIVNNHLTAGGALNVTAGGSLIIASKSLKNGFGVKLFYYFSDSGDKNENNLTFDEVKQKHQILTKEIFFHAKSPESLGKRIKFQRDTKLVSIETLENEKPKFNWPWGAPIELLIEGKQGQVETVIDFKNPFKEKILGCEVTIEKDAGSILLGGIKCTPSQGIKRLQGN